MTTLTQITRTSGRTIATALLAGGLIAGTATANPASAGNNWGNNGRGWSFNWAPALALGALASGLNSRDNGADERAAFNRGFLAGRNNIYARPPVVYNLQPYPPGTVWYQQPMQLQGWQPAYSNGWRLSAQVPYNQGQYQPPPRVVHTPRLSDWQNNPLDPGRMFGGTAEGDQPNQPSQSTDTQTSQSCDGPLCEPSIGLHPWGAHPGATADNGAAGTAGAADEDNYQITPRIRF